MKQISFYKPFAVVGALLLVYLGLLELLAYIFLGPADPLADKPSFLMITIVPALITLVLGAILAQLFKSTKAKTAAIVGASIIAAANTWLTADGLIYQLTNAGGGANIGLGLIMLATPFIAFMIMAIILFLGRSTN